VPRLRSGRTGYRFGQAASRKRMSRRTALSPADAQHCNGRDFRSAFGPPPRNTVRDSTRNTSAGRAIRPGNRGKEQRRGGHSDAALYPEMLGRRRTQAGVIIRTDSQRNVSRGNRLVRIFPAAQGPHPISEIFRHPLGHPNGTRRWQHGPVFVGSPAVRLGPIPGGGGKPGPWGRYVRYPGPPAPHR